ncbi:hypothetical protein QUB28_14870 [Microcoleus sp. B4-C3]|uniref:hypothetical protein n=1 Tax=Microcoleus sp. B4-C2 TaxID=2818661 RepID=UPI002FD79C19
MPVPQKLNFLVGSRGWASRPPQNTISPPQNTISPPQNTISPKNTIVYSVVFRRL